MSNKYPLVTGSSLSVGDLIKYKSSEIRYLVLEKKDSISGQCNIILVRPIERAGKIIYCSRSSTDFINKFNNQGKISRDWNRKVQLLSQGNSITEVKEISTCI
jgi:hypothetical protein